MIQTRVDRTGALRRIDEIRERKRRLRRVGLESAAAGQRGVHVGHLAHQLEPLSALEANRLFKQDEATEGIGSRLHLELSANLDGANLNQRQDRRDGAPEGVHHHGEGETR